MAISFRTQITVLFASLVLALSSSHAATQLAANLLVNGDAEASPGATNKTDIAVPTGWKTTGNFAAVAYAGGDALPSDPDPLPKAADSATIGGGTGYFAGGPNNTKSSASQLIDISDRAGEIDAGQYSVWFSAMLGGNQSYNGYAGTMSMTVQLRDASGAVIAQQSISGSGAFGYHSGYTAAPIGTRSVAVTLAAAMTGSLSQHDTYNHSYADNVNVQLIKTAQVNTWAQSFGNPGNRYTGNGNQAGFDFASEIAPLPDGGVVVYGVLSLSGKDTDVLIRYGPDGKILWTKQFNDSWNTFGYALGHVATDKQGNIYFASQFPDLNNNNPAYPYVAKFNADGVQQWFTNIKVPHSEALNQDKCPLNAYEDREGYLNGGFSNIVVSDDGTVALGSVIGANECDNTQSFPAIVTLNASTGAASFLGFYSTNNTDAHATGGISALARSVTTGNYAMLTGDPDGSGALVLVSPSGATLAVQDFGFGRYARPLLIATADGGFLVVTNSGIPNTGFRDGSYIYKFVEQQTRFGSGLILQFAKGTPVEIYSASERPEGGYLFETVLSSQQYPKTNPCIFELDRLGRLEKAFIVSGNKHDDGYGGAAVATADGGIAFAARSSSYATSLDQSDPLPDWWVVKMDQLGRIANFIDVDVDGGPLMLSTGMFDVDPLPTFNSGLPFTNPETFGLENPALKAPQSLQSVDAQAAIGVQAAPAFLAPPPVHGGIGGTTLTVNGNTTAVKPDLAGSILHFVAEQGGRVTGMSVRVQYSSNPTSEASWTDLPNDDHGFMLYDVNGHEYVLNSTNYPLQNGVYFRALAFGGGYPTAASNVIGPFNLADTATHLSPVTLHLSSNGVIADIYFSAVSNNLPSNASVRVQYTTTPRLESSWTDMLHYVGGGVYSATLMSACDPAYPGQYYMLASNLPDGTPTSGVYFRAVASAQGAIDSLSGAIGPKDLLSNHKPPTVTVTVPGSSGSGTVASPFVVTSGVVTIKVTATTDTALQSLSLHVNSGAQFTVNDGTKTIDYSTTLTPGDHVVDALAVDTAGATAREGSGAVILRVLSPKTTAKAELGGGGTASASIAASRTFTVAIDGGEWSDPTTWKDVATGTNGVPGENDFAIVGTSNVRITQLSPYVGSVSMNGGMLVGGDTERLLTVFDKMTIFAGTIGGKVAVQLEPSAVLELANADDIRFVADATGASGRLACLGALKIHGMGGITGASGLSLLGTIQWDVPLTAPAKGGLLPPAAIRQISANGPIELDANVTGTDPGHLVRPQQWSSDDGSSVISNDGSTVISNDGSTLVDKNGGTIITDNGSGLISNDGSSLISNDGSSLVDTSGSPILLNSGANILLNGGANLINSNGTEPGLRTNARAASTSSGIHQTGGELNLSSCTVLGDVVQDGGVLSGSGLILGNVSNNAGYVMPGHSAGAIGIAGSYTQGAKGTLVIERGGPYSSQSDQLAIGGAANLGGTLDVKLINGYTPAASDAFNPMAYSSLTGSFAATSANAQANVNGSGVVITLDPAKLNPKAGQPVNIATRLAVQTGDNVLFAGFFVTGPAGSSKKVLVRGLGPSLPVSGSMSDPLLELHNPDGSTVVNDNWRDADTTAIPTGLSPSNDKESVIVATLTVGSVGYSGYTVILKGAHGEQGVGLVEVYDLDTAGAAQLANIATRGMVQTGDNVLIGGFIVQGSEPAKMLVRATGPSSGVAGALADPVLEVHDSNGSVISNDNWRETQETEINATGLAPKDNREPAILATLVPGAYTAVVRGVNDSTGVAVVEAYNLQ